MIPLSWIAIGKPFKLKQLEMRRSVLSWEVFSFFFESFGWCDTKTIKNAYVTNLQSMSQDKLLKSQQASCHMRFDKQGSFHSQPRGPRLL